MAAKADALKRPWLGTRGELTLLHMNVLAQTLTTSKPCDKFGVPGTAFPHVEQPDVVFDPARRMKLLLQVLTEHKPDVMCLAEVDEEMFNEIANALPKAYIGMFQHKNTNCNDAHDGTAIFYLSTRVQCLRTFSNSIDPKSSQVVMYAHLRMRSDKRKSFVVAATHLKAKLGCEEVRKNQCISIMMRMATIMKNITPPPTMFLLGDLNDTPDSQCIKYLENNPLQIQSAYAKFYRSKTADEYYTTYKKREEEVRRVIDYIYYQSYVTTCEGVASIPPISAFPNRLPAVNYPSDHLAMVASFVFE